MVCLCVPLAAVRFVINGRPVGALIRLNCCQNENGQLNGDQMGNGGLNEGRVRGADKDDCSLAARSNNSSGHGYGHGHGGEGGHMALGSIKLNGSEAKDEDEDVSAHGAKGAHRGRDREGGVCEGGANKKMDDSSDVDVDADAHVGREERVHAHVALASADGVQGVKTATQEDATGSKTWLQGDDSCGKRVCAAVSVGGSTKAVVMLSACWSLAEDVGVGRRDSEP